MSRFATKWLVFSVALCLAAASAGAQVCSQWKWSNPLPQGNRLAGVAYGAGRFVVVGSAGTILTSSNGQDWTARNSGTRQDLEGVLWTGQAFVGVGAAGTVVSSRDGEDWVVRSARTQATLHRAAWSGNQLVAVGDGGVVFTSPDGDKWTAGSSGVTSSLRNVIWSRSRFLAVGDLGTILVSADGLSWSRSAFSSIDVLSAVADNGSEFVVASTGFLDNINILHSADGLNWTADEIGLAPPVQALRWMPSGYVGVGQSGSILRSMDGRTWTRTTAPGGDLLDVATDGATYVAVGSRGTIVTSPDSDSWKAQSPGPRGGLADMASLGGVDVAVGVGGTIATSTNGGPWSLVTSGVDRWLLGVASNGTRLVAVGEAGHVVTSRDAATWVTGVSGTTQNLQRVIWDGSRFVAVGTGGVVLVSDDGASWRQTASLVQNTLKSIAFNGSIYVAVGGDFARLIYTSTDAVNWTRPLAETGGGLSDVTWNSQQRSWFAAGNAGLLLKSQDGVVWSPTTVGSRDFDGIASVGPLTVAVGQGGAEAISADGSVWEQADSATANDLYGVRNVSGRLFGFGRYGTILSSDCGPVASAVSVGGRRPAVVLTPR